MDAYRIEGCIAQASIGLTRGTLMRVEDGRGTEISVVYGALWLTQHADTDDVCIGAGESFRIGRDGLTIVSAMKSSLVALTLPGMQNRAARVSMVAAAREADRVVRRRRESQAEPARRLAGQVLGAALQRVRRPTTAAL